MPPEFPQASKTLDPLTLETEAQQVLDELWQEKLVPFVLNVGKIINDMGEYTIHFHDSRIFTARFPITESISFREMVRTAVLARVAQLVGSP